jgi:hypothetical protein
MTFARWFLISIVCCTSIPTLTAGNVAITNVSKHNTALEVNNAVSAYIWGAPANKPVTLEYYLNGNRYGPYLWGTTLADGTYYTIGTVHTWDVGSWVEYWRVDGQLMTEVNQDDYYFPYAPSLPDFSVYNLYTGTNCPPQAHDGSACGGGINTALHWVFTPVSYKSYSSVAPQATVNTAAANWNSITNNRINLTSNLGIGIPMISVYDSSLDEGTLARTLAWAYNCEACYNQYDICSGACLNAAAVWEVDIQLDNAQIAEWAGQYGTSAQTLAAVAVNHELGHALRLGHPSIGPGKCSQVKSVTHPSVSLGWFCNVRTPQSSCDGSSLASVYPASLPYCYPGYQYCNGTPCS